MDKPEPDGIEKSIGSFGRWQFWMCVILYLLKLPIAWHQLMIVVIAPPIEDFTCVDNSDKCAANCSRHKFDRSIFTDTIIMKWDLVCEKKHVPNLIQSLTMIGILTGNLFCGFVADRCGRKYVLIVSIVVQVISGCIAAFVPWLWAFLTFKFINAASTGGTMLTSFVLIMEIVGVRWRTIVGSMYHIPFCLGHLLLAPIAYFIRDWHYLQLACSLPISVIFIFLWIIPESPRWLISVGKRQQAINVLERLAKFNRLPTENIEQNVDEYIAARDLKATAGGNLKDIFRTKRSTAKFFFIIIGWFNCGFGYFGVAQFIGYLKGDLFINVALSGAFGIPGMILAVIFLQTIGRKPTLLTANLIAALGMFTLAPFRHLEWVAPICASFTIFGLSIGFSAVYTYCGELFPTIIRNVAIGLASMIARLGSVAAPNVLVLEDTEYKWIVPVIFGTVSFMSFLVSLWLPETKDCKLPDTVEDAEQFKISIKFDRHDHYEFV